MLLRQRAELARDGAAQLVEARELDDPDEVVGLERRHLDAEARQRPALGRAAAQVAREHVAGDAEQPRGGLLVGGAAKAPARLERLRERLGGQVERRLGS